MLRVWTKTLTIVDGYWLENENLTLAKKWHQAKAYLKRSRMHKFQLHSQRGVKDTQKMTSVSVKTPDYSHQYKHTPCTGPRRTTHNKLTVGIEGGQLLLEGGRTDAELVREGGPLPTETPHLLHQLRPGETEETQDKHKTTGIQSSKLIAVLNNRFAKCIGQYLRLIISVF